MKEKLALLLLASCFHSFIQHMELVLVIHGFCSALCSLYCVCCMYRKEYMYDFLCIMMLCHPEETFQLGDTAFPGPGNPSR